MKKYFKLKFVLVLASLYTIGIWSNNSFIYAEESNGGYTPITEEDAGSDAADEYGDGPRPKCGYTQVRLQCSYTKEYAGGINGQVTVTPPSGGGGGAGITGSVKQQVSYWYNCVRDGGDLEQCTISACNGSITIVRCKK